MAEFVEVTWRLNEQIHVASLKKQNNGLSNHLQLLKENSDVGADQ